MQSDTTIASPTAQLTQVKQPKVAIRPNFIRYSWLGQDFTGCSVGDRQYQFSLRQSSINKK
jgi:hypothetical protein